LWLRFKGLKDIKKSFHYLEKFSSVCPDWSFKYLQIQSDTKIISVGLVEAKIWEFDHYRLSCSRQSSPTRISDRWTTFKNLGIFFTPKNYHINFYQNLRFSCRAAWLIWHGMTPKATSTLWFVFLAHRRYSLFKASL